ncbi:hypothetical protein P168DRAFT_326539, partial [Aspergillus campestris IBT 28561]
MVQAAATAANTKSEKEKLNQRKESTSGLLKKASVTKHFPSTVDFFGQKCKNEDVDMKKIDKALSEHQSKYKQLENLMKKDWDHWTAETDNTAKSLKAMRTTFGTSIGTTAAIQHETQGLQVKTSGLETENATLRDSLEKYKRSFAEQLSTLEKKVDAAHKRTAMKSASGLAENVEAFSKRIDELSSEFERLSKQGSTATPLIPDPHIEDLRNKYSALEAKIQSAQESNGQNSTSLKKAIKQVDDHETRLRAVKIEGFSKRLDDVDRLLRSTEAHHKGDHSLDELKILLPKLKVLVNHPHQEQLNAAVSRLETGIRDLRDVGAMKDDLFFADIAELRQTLTGQSNNLTDYSKEITELKGSYGRISEELRSLSQQNSAAASERIAKVESTVDETQALLNTVKIGLSSLETRYNNLSTEPIVKNMICAMQEMYPSAGQLTEHVAALKRQFDQEVSLMKSQIDQCRQQQAQPDPSLRSDMNALRQNHTGLVQSVMPLVRQFQSGSFATEGDLQGLTQKVDKHISRTEMQLSSKRAADEFLQRSICAERDHLTTKFDGLAGEFGQLNQKQDDQITLINQLTSDLHGITTQCHTIDGQLKSLSGDYKSLESDIADARAMGTNNDEKLQSHTSDIAELFGTTEKLGHTFTALQDTGKELQKTTQYLKTTTRELEDSIKRLDTTTENLTGKAEALEGTVHSLEVSMSADHQLLSEQVVSINGQGSARASPGPSKAGTFPGLSAPEESIVPKEESPAESEPINGPTLDTMDLNPAQAILTKSRKRPRRSSVDSESESSSIRVGTPGSQSPAMSINGASDDGRSTSRKRLNKKAKKKLRQNPLEPGAENRKDIARPASKDPAKDKSKPRSKDKPKDKEERERRRLRVQQEAQRRKSIPID